MSSSGPFIVVGLGEVLWDMLPEGKQLGGAPANFTYHAQALGARGYVVSAVGQDELGQEILDTLGYHGLATDYVQRDKAHPTSRVSIEMDAEGVPAYNIHEGVAWDFLNFTERDAALAREAHAICFGSLASRNRHSQESIRKFLEAAMPGCLRVFDVNLRQRYYSQELLLGLLEHAEVLKLNEDELPVLADLLNIPGSTKDRMEALVKRFALDCIALTRGGRGSLLMTPDGLEVHKGVRVENMADTVGAGDSFTAMVVTGLLNGWPLDEISERANQLAGHVCGHHGAMAPHPEGMASPAH